MFINKERKRDKKSNKLRKLKIFWRILDFSQSGRLEASRKRNKHLFEQR